MPWQAGPAHGGRGPVLVSLTDFRLANARYLPGAYVAAMRLQRAWPRLEGAVGLWLWAKPLQRRSGSVSVWRSEEDLMAFVRWPVHVAIMCKYRGRGKLTSTTWAVNRFVADDVWNEAAQRLASCEIAEERSSQQDLG
jgi:hypothetical protein